MKKCNTMTAARLGKGELLGLLCMFGLAGAAVMVRYIAFAPVFPIG